MVQSAYIGPVGGHMQMLLPAAAFLCRGDVAFFSVAFMCGGSMVCVRRSPPAAVVAIEAEEERGGRDDVSDAAV